MSCPDCFKGHIHDGEHIAGSETELHGRKAYVTEPPGGMAPTGLIVVVPDAFGWGVPNIRIVADAYAKRTGCRVYIPDFMDGHSAPAWLLQTMAKLMGEKSWWDWLTMPYLIGSVMYAFLPFILYYNPIVKSYPKIQKFMDDFRCAEGASLKVGAVGFCWGGYQVTQLAHGALAKNGKPLVDAVFTAHPSGLNVPGDIENIKQPYSVAVGDIDFALAIKGVKQMEAVLEGLKDVKSEVVILPGAKHGFAIRGDPEDKKEMEQADQAEDQCVRWFGKYLA